MNLQSCSCSHGFHVEFFTGEYSTSDESTRFILVGVRRVFVSSTNTCYLSGRHPCSSHRSHPGCLDRELVEAMSEAFFGWELWLSPPLMASGEMALFLLQNVSGRGADARRGFAMFWIIHIFLQQVFSSLNVSGLLPFRSNKLCIFVSALGLSPL